MPRQRPVRALLGGSPSKVAVPEQRHMPEIARPDHPAPMAGKSCPCTQSTQSAARHGDYLWHRRWCNLFVRLGKETGLLKGSKRKKTKNNTKQNPTSLCLKMGESLNHNLNLLSPDSYGHSSVQSGMN